MSSPTNSKSLIIDDPAHVPGRHGIKNEGTDCFVIASAKLLADQSAVYAWALRFRKSGGQLGRIQTAFVDFTLHHWEGTCSGSVAELRAVVAAHTPPGWASSPFSPFRAMAHGHQDPEEFTQLLLLGLHDEAVALGQPGATNGRLETAEDPFVSAQDAWARREADALNDLFTMVLKVERRCANCDGQFATFELVSRLSVPMKSNTLCGCLRVFFALHAAECAVAPHLAASGGRVSTLAAVGAHV